MKDSNKIRSITKVLLRVCGSCEANCNVTSADCSNTPCAMGRVLQLQKYIGFDQREARLQRYRCNGQNGSTRAKRQQTLFRKLNEKGSKFSCYLPNFISRQDGANWKLIAGRHVPLLTGNAVRYCHWVHLKYCCSCLVIGNQTGFKVTFISFCDTLYGFCCYSSNGSLDKGHLASARI